MEVVLIHVLLKVVHTHQQLFIGSLVARRTRETLSITSLTAWQFQCYVSNDAIFSNLPEEPICMQCIDLKDKLHEQQSEIIDIFVEIQAWYTENVQLLEDKQDIGEFAKCLLNYLEQVESFLNLISSCQTENSDGYLSSLENIIKHFFACDLLNYARLMPVQQAQMNALETEDPEIWSALKSGGFAVDKSEILSLICSLAKPLSRK